MTKCRQHLENGDTSTAVCKDVIVLDAPSTPLADEHTRVHSFVNLIAVDKWICAAHDGHSSTPIEGDVIVFNDAPATIANKYSHTLSMIDHVVLNVPVQSALRSPSQLGATMT